MNPESDVQVHVRMLWKSASPDTLPAQPPPGVNHIKYPPLSLTDHTNHSLQMIRCFYFFRSFRSKNSQTTSFGLNK